MLTYLCRAILVSLFRIVVVLGALIATGIGISAMIGASDFGGHGYLLGILIFGLPVTLAVIGTALVVYGLKTSAAKNTRGNLAEFSLARKLSEHQVQQEQSKKKLGEPQD